jgi:O-succinylbenzoate synthase
MRALPPEVRSRIDFIEDPFPYDGAAWCAAQDELGMRLACDKGLKRPEESMLDDCGYEVAVLKPGRRDWRSALAAIPANARIVMTSAMDHAIGQSFAAWEAAMAWRELGARMDLCGLCTEHLFEKDSFFERLSSCGGKLKVDRDGTGLGFDDVLDELTWEEL